MERAMTHERIKEIADLWTDTDFGSFMECLLDALGDTDECSGNVTVPSPGAVSPYPADVVTVAQLIDTLTSSEHVSDNTIVTIYDDAPRDWYRHVSREIDLPTGPDGDGPATVILSMSRDYDTREV